MSRRIKIVLAALAVGIISLKVIFTKYGIHERHASKKKMEFPPLIGPLFPPEACYRYGGDKYLKKYRESVWMYRLCEHLASEAIAQSSDQNKNSDEVFHYCATAFSKLCCFSRYAQVAGPCMGPNNFETVQNLIGVFNRTAYNECTQPEKLSVILASGMMQCIMDKSSEIVSTCFKEFATKKEDGCNSVIAFSFPERFNKIFKQFDAILCWFLANNVICILNLIQGCSNSEAFSYVAEVLVNMINRETKCAFDTSVLLVHVE